LVGAVVGLDMQVFDWRVDGGVGIYGGGRRQGIIPYLLEYKRITLDLR